MAEVILPIGPIYNEWGDLIFKDHDGKEWKIGKGKTPDSQEKRSGMHQIILDAAVDKKMVELDIKEFRGHPFIDGVRLAGEAVGGTGSQDMSVMEESAKAGEEHLVKEAERLGGKVEKVVEKPSKDATITRAVAFKGAIELAANGKITIEEIDGYTATFIPIVRGW